MTTGAFCPSTRISGTTRANAPASGGYGTTASSDIGMQNSYYTCGLGFNENDGNPLGPFWDNPDNPGSHIGRLIKRKYLGQSRNILKCPALPEVISLNQSGNPNNSYRGGYYFNPHPAFDNAFPAGDTLTTRYKKIRQIPKERCLACDFFYDKGTLPHLDTKTHTLFLNVVFADGHAVSQPDQRGYDKINGYGGGGSWKWSDAIDVIGPAELLASGLSVDTKGPGQLYLPNGDKSGGTNEAYYSAWPSVPH